MGSTAGEDGDYPHLLAEDCNSLFAPSEKVAGQAFAFGAFESEVQGTGSRGDAVSLHQDLPQDTHGSSAIGAGVG